MLDSLATRLARWCRSTGAAPDRRAWLTVFSVVLPIFLLTAHWAMVSVDTSSAFIPAWQLVHHGNLWVEGLRHPPYWSIHSGHHLVSNRTPGVILVNVPAYLLFYFLGPVALGGAITAAVLTAATVATLYLVTRRFASADVALATALIAALGTSLWSIASAEIWTHTVDAFCLAFAMLLLTRHRYLAAGVVIGAGSMARPHLIVVAAVLGLYLAWHHRSLRPVIAVGAGSVPGFASLLVLNREIFGHWTLSGYGSYVTQSLTTAGGAPAPGSGLSAAAGHYAANVTGFLVSPLCGLLLYLPIALLLIAGFRPAWRAAPGWCRGMFFGGVAYTLVQLKINSYVGGAAFYGYRLATELVVCACPLAVFAYKEWAARRTWRVVGVKALAVASVVIQAVGVTCYDIAKSAPVKPWPSDFVAAYGHRPLVATVIVIGGIAAAWLWITRQAPGSDAGAPRLKAQEGAPPKTLLPAGSAG